LALLGLSGPGWHRRQGSFVVLVFCAHALAPSLPHSPAQELEEARKEAAALVELLELRQGSLAATLDGGFPELRDTGQ